MLTTSPITVRLMTACRAILAACVAAMMPLSVTPLNATGDLLTPPHAWKTVKLPNRNATMFRFTSSGQLDVTAKNSVAFMLRDMKKTPDASGHNLPKRVTWQWRVRGDFAVTDLARRGGDDRPIAVHLFFGKPGARASIFGKLLSSFPPKGYALTYAWGGKRPVGSVFANPYLADGRILIVRNAVQTSGEWIPEERDIAADLRKAFGTNTAIGPLLYIAVSGDADDTGTRSRASIQGLRFVGRRS